jgi:hypothetical protein
LDPKRQRIQLLEGRAQPPSVAPVWRASEAIAGNAGKTNQGREFSEKGNVKWNVYGEYAKASNLFAVAIYVITLIGAQTAEIGKLQNFVNSLPTAGVSL